MRSCRAKHNGFVSWEPNGALCLLTENPQNGAGQVGGGTMRTKAGWAQLSDSKGRHRAREALGSYHSPLSCGVSTQGRVGCGSSDGKGVVLTRLQVEKIETGSPESRRTENTSFCCQTDPGSWLSFKYWL